MTPASQPGPPNAAGGATPFPTIGQTPGPAVTRPVQTGVSITGSVKVPAGIIAAGGMNLQNPNGAGLVAAGSGNIIAAGGMNYSLFAVEEKPAAGAKVFLADAAGNPIPDLPTVQTDANGNFKIPNVPPDFTFVVACEVGTKDGKKATFQSLAKPGKLGATCEVDSATTLVASNVLEDLKGGNLGEFNPAVFKTATETTAKNLKPEQLPDFTDRAAVKKKMAELVETVAELKQSVGQLKQELSDIKKTLDDLRSELKKQREQPPVGTNPVGDPGVRPDGTPGDPAPPTFPSRSDAPSFPPPDGTIRPDLPPPTTAPPVGSGAEDYFRSLGCTRGEHQFYVPEPAKVASIDFKVMDPNKRPEEWMNSGTAHRDRGYYAHVAEGCKLMVVFRDDAGHVIARKEGFFLQPGSPKEIKLDFGTTTTQPLPAGTTSPPPSTGGTAEDYFRSLGCSRGEHQFFPSDPARAAWIEFKAMDPNKRPHEWWNTGTAKRDVSYWSGVAEGCKLQVVFHGDGGEVTGIIDGFVIPPGSPKEIKLQMPPPPSGTGTATPAPTNTGGTTQPPPGSCTEHRAHKFKVRTGGGYYLLFNVPNSGDPPKVAGEAKVQLDGYTFETRVPEGCAHDVKLFDMNWQYKGGIKGYVIPVGAPYEIPLEI